MGGGLNIGKAALTLTGANNAVTYNGTAQSNSGATLSGVQGSDSFTITGYASGTSAGTYTDSLGVSANGASLMSNYTLSIPTEGVLTVGKAALTVTGNTASSTYNGAVQTNGFTTSTLYGSDSVTGVSGLASGTNAGQYTDNLSNATGSGLSNYTIAYVGGSLNIGKASLTVTADSQSKVYGADGLNTSLFTTTGLVSGDSVSAVNLASAGAAAGANVGSYAIIASNATGTGLGNYNITYVAAPGGLTVTPASLTIAVLNANKTYDGQGYSGGNGVSYTGFVNGDSAGSLSGVLTYAGAAQGAVKVGSYALTASGLSSANYNITYDPGVLVITPAAPTFAVLPSLYLSESALPSLRIGITDNGVSNGPPHDINHCIATGVGNAHLSRSQSAGDKCGKTQ